MKLWICLLICMQGACVFNQNIKFIDPTGGINFAVPDSKGYRYCAYWSLPDGTFLYSSCNPFTMDRCGRTATFDYKCCHGFQESHGSYSHPGCSQVISPYQTCAQTLSSLGTNVKYNHPHLADELDQRKPYTVFSPLELNGRDKNGKIDVLQHTVNGRFYANELRDEMKLQTFDSKRSLYVSKYYYGVTAIDCVELTNVDLECSTGLIHNIRHPLHNPGQWNNQDRSSVLRLIQNNPETSLFAEDLPLNLRSSLEDVNSGKRYTILAPSRQSWESIRREYSDDRLAKISTYHILENQVCSAELIRSSNIKHSIDGQQIEIVCDFDQQNRERQQIRTPCGDKIGLLETDITAENGVVHLIDQPMIPLSVYTMEKLKTNKNCAKTLKIKEFIKLMEECDLNIDDNEKYIAIMPQDEAFQWWSTYSQFQSQYQRFQVDKEYRCTVARYHVILNSGGLRNISHFTSFKNAHRTSNINSFLYETSYFKRTIYGPQLNFHYSPVLDLQAIELHGVSIYLTTRINVMPEENITDILNRLPNTRITYQKTLESGLNEKIFKMHAPNNLYLVTTDLGWKDPRKSTGPDGSYRSEYALYSNDTLEKFLLLHHVQHYLWGGDIGYFERNSIHTFMSSANQELIFYMDKDGLMRIGYHSLPLEEWPRVVKWNIAARDGIIWLLDGIIKCPEKICPSVLADVDTYDVFVAACQTASLSGETDVRKEFQSKPIDVANRHLDQCTLLLQFSGQSVASVDVNKHG